MLNTLFLLNVVISLVIFPEAISITLNDLSVTSAITGDELSLLLLTKEKFTCTATVNLNGTLLNTTTLCYNVSINTVTVDSGCISLSNDEILANPLLIESSEIHVDKTGNIKLAISIWSDNYNIESRYTETELFAITGFTTMVPIIVIIFIAIYLKNIYVSLYLGIWVGSFIISGLSFRYAFEMSLATYIMDSCTDEDHQYIILFTVFLGGIIFLIQRSGGTKGFSKLMHKLAKNEKRTQLSCFLSGIFLFFGDYTSALVVGTTFQSLTDMFHISREKLAFIVDATAAPVASIMPISTWIGFELQQIQQQLDLIKKNNQDIMPEGLTDNAFVFFIQTIPTRFYPIYMLVFQVIIISLSIEFGPMLISERLVRVNKRTDGGKGSNINKQNDLDLGAEPDQDTPARWWNMLIPIMTLIILIIVVIINTGIEQIESDPTVNMNVRNIFASSDAFSSLLYGTFGCGIFTIFFYMIQFKFNGRIVIPSITSCRHYLCDNNNIDKDKQHIPVPLLTFSEAIDTWIKGGVFMMPAVFILILVWSIGGIMTDIGADRYFTRIISHDLDPQYLPTIVFMLAALLSGVTGSAWGTMTILFPIVGPAAWSMCEPLDNGVFLYTATLSQILSGSIFGDHSSPLSDTTILSSIASGCDLFRHVWTQMPYAIWVSLFSVICGTIMVGKGINVGVCIFVGIIVLTLCTWFIAAPVIAKNGRYDVFIELYLCCLNKCSWKCCRNKQHMEKELMLLKKTTVEFVTNGGKENSDFFIKLLSLLSLDVCCRKGYVGDKNDTSMMYYGSVMTYIPAEPDSNVIVDSDHETNILEQEGSDCEDFV
eukprot:306410_1